MRTHTEAPVRKKKYSRNVIDDFNLSLTKGQKKTYTEMYKQQN